MPRRLSAITKQTHQTLKNTSRENEVISWLMYDGWQVFTPVLDNGHKTDILISDGNLYYRLQVKTVDATDEGHKIENRWKESSIDVVICFARNSNWGYVLPAFSENTKKLNSDEHQRFNDNRKEFLTAFHKLEV